MNEIYNLGFLEINFINNIGIKNIRVILKKKLFKYIWYLGILIVFDIILYK